MPCSHLLLRLRCAFVHLLTPSVLPHGHLLQEVSPGCTQRQSPTFGSDLRWPLVNRGHCVSLACQAVLPFGRCSELREGAVTEGRPVGVGECLCG